MRTAMLAAAVTKTPDIRNFFMTTPFFVGGFYLRAPSGASASAACSRALSPGDSRGAYDPNGTPPGMKPGRCVYGTKADALESVTARDSSNQRR
jgi:hypothetical protein